MTMDACLLALDIGGTKLATGVVTPAGHAIEASDDPTPVEAAPEQIIDDLFRAAQEAMARAGKGWGDVGAVGVSFGGPVDFPAGRTVTCHHLRGWEGIPLRDIVAERSGLPAIMDNDANAAALGEAAFGAARGFAHVLYLTVSTGIGGGLTLDGRVHRGANSMAGEIGHTLVAPDGPLCTCGRRGCLEAVAAGPAIARAAREALDAGQQSSLSSLPRADVTAKQVAEAAPTDGLAARIMARAGEVLGIAIAGAVNLVNPDIVVIGGGVSAAGDVLFRPLRQAVVRHAVPASTRGLRIVPGELGQSGALLGAAALARDLVRGHEHRQA